MDQNNNLQFTPMPLGIAYMGENAGQAVTLFQKPHLASITLVPATADCEMFSAYNQFWSDADA